MTNIEPTFEGVGGLLTEFDSAESPLQSASASQKRETRDGLVNAIETNDLGLDYDVENGDFPIVDETSNRTEQVQAVPSR